MRWRSSANIILGGSTLVHVPSESVGKHRSDPAFSGCPPYSGRFPCRPSPRSYIPFRHKRRKDCSVPADSVFELSDRLLVFPLPAVSQPHSQISACLLRRQALDLAVLGLGIGKTPQLYVGLAERIAVRRARVQPHRLGILCARVLVFSLRKIEISQLDVDIVTRLGSIWMAVWYALTAFSGSSSCCRTWRGTALHRPRRRSCGPAPRTLEFVDRLFIVSVRVGIDAALKAALARPSSPFDWVSVAENRLSDIEALEMIVS